MKSPLGKGLQSLIPKKESRISGFFKQDKRPSGRSESGGLNQKESVFNITLLSLESNTV